MTLNPKGTKHLKTRFLLPAELCQLPRRLALGVLVILEHGFWKHARTDEPFIFSIQIKNTILAGIIVFLFQIAHHLFHCTKSFFGILKIILADILRLLILIVDPLGNHDDFLRRKNDNGKNPHNGTHGESP